ncbi:sensor histidine kinase [Blastopirellula retiformator]|uniref:sensor histidine kinase n=1 Tax=Blastopirellula retiformator TaxID=2527970 RepID=UPI001FE75D08|nr:ATP-binding protein [Blastopirellula retiformator]
MLETMNLAAQELFSFSVNSASPTRIGALLPEFAGDPLGEAAESRSFLALVGQSRETIALRKDGTQTPVEATFGELTLGGRRIYTGLFRDLTQRKRLEMQITHAQRMESAGELAAGIAHEINTPIQYVCDNAQYLDRSIVELTNFFEQVAALAETTPANPPTAELMDQFRREALDGDWEFFIAEAPLAVKQVLEGAESVAKIVRAMKEFSHPGLEEQAAVDLNHALQSTLTISRNQWDDVAEVITEFDDSLPLVNCFPCDLNQAFLNIIMNAVYAIRKAADPRDDRKGTISIRTRYTNDWVEIHICDDGVGIPEEIREKIFDPFFTTKEIGEGTGQGLAIVRSIVVGKHRGEIECDSKVGAGASFTLRLPNSTCSLH